MLFGPICYIIGIIWISEVSTMEKETKEIQASITITAKDLFFFMLQHTYRSVGGALSLLFSIGAFFLLLRAFTTVELPYKVILIISSLLFTVINPFLLYLRSVKQVKRKEGFCKPILYTFTKKGFTMQQGKEQATALWSDLWKIRDGKKYLFLYGNTIRANIIPKNQLNGQQEEISKFIREGRKSGKKI